MEVLRPNSTILTVCENGYGKRSKAEDYRLIHRGGKGVINVKVTERNGEVISIKEVIDDDELIMLTQEGMSIRVNVGDIRVISRNTQGVRLINLKQNDKIVAVARMEEKEEGKEVAEGEEVADEEEEGEFLRQSHDFEFSYGITERWLFSTTLGTDEPLDGDYDVSSVEVEMQYEIIQREGNGLGLAFTGGYGFATRGGEADEIEFGPIVELASGKLLLTFNPFFSAQVGDNRETDGLGFEYGWRAEYDFTKHWGIGVEMFGEIEDLANAGSFDDQTHSLGPTLFYNPGEEEDEGEGEKGGDDDKLAEAPETEFSLNVGVQFGLTDATSDTALKFQGSLTF
jgi:hypothetical protein